MNLSDGGQLCSPILTMAALVLGEVFDKIYAVDEGSTLLVEDILKVSLLLEEIKDQSHPSGFAVEWEVYKVLYLSFFMSESLHYIM